MSGEIPPGRPGNLTEEQEEKLRKMWQSIFQLCGVIGDGNLAPSDVLSSQPEPEEAKPEAAKKKHFGMFRKSKSGTSTPASTETSKEAADEDKHGQMKQFQDALASRSPQEMYETIWDMIKHDHPDALVLRFLRARKWDVEKALVMLISTMNWRFADMHLDDDIMKNGEEGAVKDEKSDNAETKELARGFIEQTRAGKSVLHGTDKQGRPICWVRVRLHKPGEHTEGSIERYTVYVIETTRMVLSGPIDTASIVFDMTGFSLANMDYTPVKFIIKVFEANYPESLGTVLVHNAPWVFQGIWKIVRGWLDPVVAGKVHMTNNKAELEEYIDSKHILKEVGGEESWEYKYIEPVPGENALMDDTATRDRLLQSRKALIKEFEAATVQWVQDPRASNIEEIKSKRRQMAAQLKTGYWELDPYIRARSQLDREGTLQADGQVEWYSPKPKTSNAPAPATVETSADDVD